jgi:site-specific DNA-methyltransferase (adenine-specific)
MIKPYVSEDRYQLYHGNCLDVLKEMPDNSIDAICTDPPYGLAFMGKKWDYDVPSVDIWKECLRVLKPGGHLLSFAGTRTQHRMAVRIEDAGFEIRDMIAWVYGSGFNKVGYIKDSNGETVRDGWGGSLKPALEPITMARKPISEGTVAANVLEHGTGAINIDGCRVGTNDGLGRPYGGENKVYGSYGMERGTRTGDGLTGRWPANLITDGSDEVVGLFPQTGPAKAAHRGTGKGKSNAYGVYGGESTVRGHDDNGGSAARFFYCAKANKKDRNEGLNGETNNHPTVKPTNLMRYLCRLITPPGGTVLDPFLGSGTTGKASLLEGFNFIGIEMEESYLDIAQQRIQQVRENPE